MNKLPDKYKKLRWVWESGFCDECESLLIRQYENGEIVCVKCGYTKLVEH